MANEQITEIQNLSAEELKDKATNLFEKNKNIVGGVIGGILVLLMVTILNEVYRLIRFEYSSIASSINFVFSLPKHQSSIFIAVIF